jgi:hypothetical protein
MDLFFFWIQIYLKEKYRLQLKTVEGDVEIIQRKPLR